MENARSSQPDWITPLATSTPRLGQEVRFDHHHQTLEDGSTVDIEGAGKGVSFIPAEHTQVTLAFPTYQTRRGVAPASGFGDWPGMLVKYRMLSETERARNYVVSLINQLGWPTGALAFTNRNRVFTTLLAAGKGFGRLSMQGNLGQAVPLRDHSRSGRTLVSNLAFQYHIGKYVWPELEFNRLDWLKGRRNGRSQTNLTIGALVGRIQVTRRNKFTVGLGYQTPVSRTYSVAPSTPTFRHNWILSTRTVF